MQILQFFVLNHGHLFIDIPARWIKNSTNVVAAFLNLLIHANLVISHQVFQLLKVLSLSVKHDLISIEYYEHGAYVCFCHMLGSLARV